MTMSELDLEYLLGGFATNTLTDAEHQALYRAAMVNQRLFDLLADEQALRDLLDDPAVRRRLLERLKDPPGEAQVSWAKNWLGWLIRPETLTVAGGMAVLALATVLGLQLWEESQTIQRTEDAVRPLSEVVKEPTVRTKLGNKSAEAPKAAPVQPKPEAARQTEAPAALRRDGLAKGGAATAPRATSPPLARSRKDGDSKVAQSKDARSDKANVANPADTAKDAGNNAPAPAARRASATKPPTTSKKTTESARPSDATAAPADRATPMEDSPAARESASADVDSSDLADLADLAEPAPAQLPPVVLPQVPQKLAKAKSDRKTSPTSPAPQAGVSAPETRAHTSTQTAQQSPAQPSASEELSSMPVKPAEQASPSKEELFKEPAPSLEMAPESVVAAVAQSAGESSKNTAAETMQASAGTAAASPPAPFVDPLPPPSVGNAKALFSDAAEETDEQDEDEAATAAGKQPRPLALRYHRQALSLQGVRSGQTGASPRNLAESLAVPRVTLEVNQPGYLYVITGNAQGGWTVLSPAGSRQGVPVEASADRAYEVMIVTDAQEQALRPTYVVFARARDADLDQAVAQAKDRAEGAPSSDLQQRLASWINGVRAQSVRIEQVNESLAGAKPGPILYVADSDDPPHDLLVYRLPPTP